MLLVFISLFAPALSLPVVCSCLGGMGWGSGYTLPIAISSEEESEPKVLTFLGEKVTSLGERSRTVDLILVYKIYNLLEMDW